MPAPAQNQNAAKPEAEKLLASLSLRALPAEKKAWLRAARDKKLNTWVREALNAAASADGKS